MPSSRSVTPRAAAQRLPFMGPGLDEGTEGSARRIGVLRAVSGDAERGHSHCKTGGFCERVAFEQGHRQGSGEGISRLGGHNDERYPQHVGQKVWPTSVLASSRYLLEQGGLARGACICLGCYPRQVRPLPPWSARALDSRGSTRVALCYWEHHFESRCDGHAPAVVVPASRPPRRRP
jgi:hypothetical protein